MKTILQPHVIAALLLWPATVCAVDLRTAQQELNQAQDRATQAQNVLTIARSRLARLSPPPAPPAGIRPTQAQKTQAQDRLNAANARLRETVVAYERAHDNLRNFQLSPDFIADGPEPQNDPQALAKWNDQRARLAELRMTFVQATNQRAAVQQAKTAAETELQNLNNLIRQFEGHEAFQQAMRLVRQAEIAKSSADAEVTTKRLAHQNALNEARAAKQTALAAALKALNNLNAAMTTETRRVLEEVNQTARSEAALWKPRYEREIQDVIDSADRTSALQSIQNTKERWQQQVDRINRERLGNYQSKFNEKIERAQAILKTRKAALERYNMPPFTDVAPTLLLMNEKIASLKPIRTAQLTPLDFGPLAERPRIISFTGRWKCNCPSLWTISETGRTAQGQVSYTATVRKGDWSMSIAGEFTIQANELVMTGTDSRNHQVQVILRYNATTRKLEGTFRNLTVNTGSGEELSRF